jgi:ACT domain-containing protein
MLACRIHIQVLLRRNTKFRILDRQVVRSLSTSSDETATKKFKLSKSFVEKYKNKTPPFGKTDLKNNCFNSGD